MSHSGHHMVRCRVCNTVMRNCRCMSADKPTLLATCDRCAVKSVRPTPLAAALNEMVVDSAAWQNGEVTTVDLEDLAHRAAELAIERCIEALRSVKGASPESDYFDFFGEAQRKGETAIRALLPEPR